MKGKFLIAVLTLVALPFVCIHAGKKPTTEAIVGKYDIVCEGNGAQGTYLIKVYSYNKKANKAEQECIKNAIHGVIFRGITGGNGCVAQRPMAAVGAEVQHAEYFGSFFAEGGEYQRYASAIVGTTEITKVGKEYKVGMVVSVNKDQLRRALEAAGVVKGLNSGF